jgi:hypothetical protein
MDNFMKKIFEKQEVDDLVHTQFTKFSKGEFPDRAMIRAKNSKGKYTIATTAEYSKEIIITLAEKLGNSKTIVNGAIISALDLEGFEYDEKKMAMGARKYMIYDREMTGEEIKALCLNINKAFFGLSFSIENTELKIAAKSPKSAKGSSSSKNPDKKAKIDFIKIKTTDRELVDNLIFENEFKDFKKIEIKHEIQVREIIMPENEQDFAKIRELAKRKGKIIRKVDIDGKEVVKEQDFEA